MARAGRRAAGALEQAVLSCLAASDGGLTAAGVQAALGDPLAYTTVMTTLGRLHAKGVVSRTARGRAWAYRLATDLDSVASETTARRMLRLLDRGPDRAGALARFVADLDPADESVLRGLLAASARGAGRADVDVRDEAP